MKKAIKILLGLIFSSIALVITFLIVDGLYIRSVDRFLKVNCIESKLFGKSFDETFKIMNDSKLSHIYFDSDENNVHERFTIEEVSRIPCKNVLNFTITFQYSKYWRTDSSFCDLQFQNSKIVKTEIKRTTW